MIIAVVAQKGGTGKTTTAAALAQAAFIKGKRVLAVDLDPQANLTYALAATAAGPGSRGLLDGIRAEYLLQDCPQGFKTIPAAWDLATVTTGPGSARRLEAALDPIRKKFDFIFLDGQPSLGELSLNALQAADAVIIPLLADAYSVQALFQITDTINAIRKSNPRLKHVFGIVTQLDARSTLTRQMLEAIRKTEAALDVVDLGTVRQSVKIKEAAALQKSLYTYAPKCKPAEDYLAIYERMEEIMQR